MKTPPFEELKSLDLQKCDSVGEIVSAMRYCAFGARMLGEVAHTIFEMVTAQDKPILIYSGIADSPLGSPISTTSAANAPVCQAAAARLQAIARG